MPTSEQVELQRLMAQLKQGDRSAFEPVYRILWPRVVRLAHRMVGPAEAEDVAQTALLRLFERISQFDTDQNAMTWALTLTAWEARTVRRRRTRSKEDLEARVGVEPVDESTEDTLLLNIMFEEVQRVISTLSERDRETLAKAFYGEEVGTSFRQRKRRALLRLQQAWRLIHG